MVIMPRKALAVVLFLLIAVLGRSWTNNGRYATNAALWAKEADQLKMENARLRGQVDIFRTVVRSSRLQGPTTISAGPAADTYNLLAIMGAESIGGNPFDLDVDYGALVSACAVESHRPAVKQIEVDRLKSLIKGSSLPEDRRTLLWDIALSREAVLQEALLAISPRTDSLKTRAAARQQIVATFLQSGKVLEADLANHRDTLSPHELACYKAALGGIR